jgi:hypothetical protein
MTKNTTTALIVLAIGGVAGYWLMTKYLAPGKPAVDPNTGLPYPPTSPLNIPQLSGDYITDCFPMPRSRRR